MSEPIEEEKLIYSDIGDLRKEANIERKYNLTEKSFIDSAKRCFEKGERYFKEGDQESSYIFFKRIMNLYSIFQKSKHFKDADMKFVKLTVGSELMKTVKYLETLQPDLERKYENKKLYEELKAKIEQNQSLTNANTVQELRDQITCLICTTARRSHAPTTCFHLSLCLACVNTLMSSEHCLRKCPICQRRLRDVSDWTKIYF